MLALLTLCLGTCSTGHWFKYLRVIRQPGGVHPAGHVDRVAPDVVLRLPGADDSGHDGADVDADPDREAVVGVVVDVLQLLPHPEDVLDELGHVVDRAEAAVLVVVQNFVLGDEADGCHVGRSDGLDLVKSSEPILADQLQPEVRVSQLQPEVWQR